MHHLQPCRSAFCAREPGFRGVFADEEGNPSLLSALPRPPRGDAPFVLHAAGGAALWRSASRRSAARTRGRESSVPCAAWSAPQQPAPSQPAARRRKAGGIGFPVCGAIAPPEVRPKEFVPNSDATRQHAAHGALTRGHTIAAASSYLRLLIPFKIHVPRGSRLLLAWPSLPTAPCQPRRERLDKRRRPVRP